MPIPLNQLTYGNQGAAPVTYERLSLTTAEKNQWVTFHNQWTPLYASYVNTATRTRSITADKNKLKNAFAAFANSLLTRMSVSPEITSADRQALRLPLRATTRTSRRLIEEVPDVNLTSKPGARIAIRCRLDTESSRASMHPEADAINVRAKIGEPPPESPGIATSVSTAPGRSSISTPVLKTPVIVFTSIPDTSTKGTPLTTGRSARGTR